LAGLGEPDFFMPKKNNKDKEGIQMRTTQSSTMIKNAGIMALLCAFAQLALAMGLFWAVREHIV
jgi:hypothetical protein